MPRLKPDTTTSGRCCSYTTTGLSVRYYPLDNNTRPAANMLYSCLSVINAQFSVRGASSENFMTSSKYDVTEMIIPECCDMQMSSWLSQIRVQHVVMWLPSPNRPIRGMDSSSTILDVIFSFYHAWTETWDTTHELFVHKHQNLSAYIFHYQKGTEENIFGFREIHSFEYINVVCVCVKAHCTTTCIHFFFQTNTHLTYISYVFVTNF